MEKNQLRVLGGRYLAGKRCARARGLSKSGGMEDDALRVPAHLEMSLGSHGNDREVDRAQHLFRYGTKKQLTQLASAPCPIRARRRYHVLLPLLRIAGSLGPRRIPVGTSEAAPPLAIPGSSGRNCGHTRHARALDDPHPAYPPPRLGAKAIVAGALSPRRISGRRERQGQ